MVSLRTELKVPRAASSHSTPWTWGQTAHTLGGLHPWTGRGRSTGESLTVPGGEKPRTRSGWESRANPSKAPFCPRIKFNLSAVAYGALHPLLPSNLIILTIQLQRTPC